jgi:CBS domain-containing protein
MTQVADVMTRGARTLMPQDPVVLAAQAMEELDVGAIPVFDGERVVGLVTDRDIVVRAVARNLPVETTPLEALMSTQIECVYEDDDLEEVAAKMQQSQIRRLPVLDREERLTGMLSLGDLAVKSLPSRAGETLADISEPSRPARDGLPVPVAARSAAVAYR